MAPLSCDLDPLVNWFLCLADCHRDAYIAYNQHVHKQSKVINLICFSWWAM